MRSALPEVFHCPNCHRRHAAWDRVTKDGVEQFRCRWCSHASPEKRLRAALA